MKFSSSISYQKVRCDKNKFDIRCIHKKEPSITNQWSLHKQFLLKFLSSIKRVFYNKSKYHVTMQNRGYANGDQLHIGGTPLPGAAPWPAALAFTGPYTNKICSYIRYIFTSNFFRARSLLMNQEFLLLLLFINYFFSKKVMPLLFSQPTPSDAPLLVKRFRKHKKHKSTRIEKQTWNRQSLENKKEVQCCKEKVLWFLHLI